MLTVKELSSKEIIFLRHSTTENNEYLRNHSPVAWGGNEEFFTDPGLRDTCLSEKGHQLVNDLNRRLRSGKQPLDKASIDLVAVSPLRRTLQTATIGLNKVLIDTPCDPKMLVCPLARERLYMEADMGHPRSVLEKEFPNFDYSELPSDDSAWWYEPSALEPGEEWRPPGQYLCAGEPRLEFGQRMIRLKNWLAEREEQRIMLVAHWGTIHSLTGKEFANCEIGVVKFNQLLSDEEILKVKV